MPTQVSDAGGTIKVVRTLLARDGVAHFVVAHPRTRFGVDAFIPLLEECLDLEYVCHDVTDKHLVNGLDEADYLAWLHISVWWSKQSAEECTSLLVEDDLEGKNIYIAG